MRRFIRRETTINEKSSLESDILNVLGIGTGDRTDIRRLPRMNRDMKKSTSILAGDEAADVGKAKRSLCLSEFYTRRSSQHIRGSKREGLSKRQFFAQLVTYHDHR